MEMPRGMGCVSITRWKAGQKVVGEEDVGPGKGM